jgi:hypothetical protein
MSGVGAGQPDQIARRIVFAGDDKFGPDKTIASGLLRHKIIF